MSVKLDLFTTNVPMKLRKQKHGNASPSKTEYAGSQLINPFSSFGQTDSHHSRHTVAPLEIPISLQAHVDYPLAYTLLSQNKNKSQSCVYGAAFVKDTRKQLGVQ
ncbi:hypothetical protein G6011_11202 [Alternaria panax]|uniref:Uncharacterized protein n=1 Tax=Alternaria panax TaxID=48097 RepID=A0AAD4ID22_9PLEO|nr:hypothetical protein G6011_11202 [Alternaria panax]